MARAAIASPILIASRALVALGAMTHSSLACRSQSTNSTRGTPLLGFLDCIGECCDQDREVLLLGHSWQQILRVSFKIDVAQVPARDPDEVLSEFGSVREQIQRLELGNCWKAK